MSCCARGQADNASALHATLDTEQEKDSSPEKVPDADEKEPASSEVCPPSSHCTTCAHECMLWNPMRVRFGV